MEDEGQSTLQKTREQGAQESRGETNGQEVSNPGSVHFEM